MNTLDRIEAATLKRAFGCFPTGVVAVAAQHEGRPVGMAASSFVSVSIDPPMVAFCVQWTSTTWPTLAKAPSIGISVLGEAHDGAARRLASRTGDRFEGLELLTSPDGAVLVEGATAWLECHVEEVVPAGDHGIVLLAVDALSVADDVAPLVFHGSAFSRLHRNAA